MYFHHTHFPVSRRRCRRDRRVSVPWLRIQERPAGVREQSCTSLDKKKQRHMSTELYSALHCYTRAIASSLDTQRTTAVHTRVHATDTPMVHRARQATDPMHTSSCQTRIAPPRPCVRRQKAFTDERASPQRTNKTKRLGAAYLLIISYILCRHQPNACTRTPPPRATLFLACKYILYHTLLCSWLGCGALQNALRTKYPKNVCLPHETWLKKRDKITTRRQLGRNGQPCRLQPGC